MIFCLALMIFDAHTFYNKKPGKLFFCVFLFVVQKINHNYDPYLKFEQKNFKNEDRTSNSISKGKMAKKKRMKK